MNKLIYVSSLFFLILQKIAKIIIVILNNYNYFTHIVAENKPKSIARMVLSVNMYPIGLDEDGNMQYKPGFTEPSAVDPAKRKTQLVEFLHEPGNPGNLSRRDRVLLASDARNIGAMAAAPPK